MKPKKALALFLVMIMCISLVPANAFADASDGVTVRKTATPVPGLDRNYDITLELAGDEIETVKPVDITLVFDVSGSMGDTSNGRTRMQMTIDAANTFIDSVMAKNTAAGNANNVRVSIVKFSELASVYRFAGSAGWKDSIGSNNGHKYYTDVASTAKSIISSLRPDGGTNTEAGFMAAKAVSDVRNSNGDHVSGRSADSYVIFMTDGVPTYRITSGGWGNGNADSGGSGSSTNNNEFNEAVVAGKALQDAGNIVYTVGLLIGYGSGSADMKCADALLADDGYYTRSNTGIFGAVVYTKATDRTAYSSQYTSISQVAGAADAIKNAYSSIANDINARATGTVTDIVPAGFTVVPGSVRPTTATVTVNPDGTTTITVNNISTGPENDPNLITYRVIANEGTYGSAYTNVSATYTYTLNETGTTGSTIFPKPVVPLAPIAVADTATTSVGETAYINVLSNDVNAKITEGGGAVTDLRIEDLSAITGPSGASVSITDGKVNFTAIAPGTYTFTYRAVATVEISGQESIVKSVPATVTVTVTGAISYSASGYQGVYDGSSHGITVTSTGVEIRYGTIEGTYGTTAPTYKNVGVYTVYYQITKPGYASITGSRTVTITPKAATVETGSASKVYDGTPLTNSTVTLGGIIVGDTVTATATGTQTIVGNSNNTVTTAGADKGNYTFTETLGTLTVTKGTLSYSSSGYEGVYDGSSHGITVMSTGAAIKYGTVEGTYDVTAPTYKNVGEYTVYYQIAKPGYTTVTGSETVKITPAPVTVTADAKSKAYGAADPELTYTSSVEGLTFTGELEREAGEDVGTYKINQGSLSAGANYTVTYVEANLTITPATVTVTADAKSKAYGAADPELTYTSSVEGLTFTGELEREAGEDVGTYKINQGSLSAGANYTVTYVEANLTITPATVTVTADAKSKAYGAADPELTYTSSVEGLTFTGELEREAGEDVGTYKINQGSLSAGANYTVTYVEANLTITPATVAVTADAKSKAYGAADPELTYTSSVEGLTFTGELEREAGEDVGTYKINQGSLSAGANYTVTYVEANLTITPATVTVTADAKSKAYGAADPELTYTSSVEGLTFTGELEREAGEDVGTYKINQGSLSAGANYTVTYVEANLTITPATVTVTADAKSKAYGAADPELTYTSSVEGLTFTGELEREAGEDVGTYKINQEA
ncbi:VWA domain-containing protein [Anoxybacterium hadale]|uniref:VWA domain-containing protein n=1 Tax=Anoxybacterium hadale TaxID=3408580 RepID=A0ACD1AAE5_9FIRM|nr:VWA domain-containing protein [Clostridiales bacterium]